VVAGAFHAAYRAGNKRSSSLVKSLNVNGF
jgi:hypothetical protein